METQMKNVKIYEQYMVECMVNVCNIIWTNVCSIYLIYG